MLRERGRNGSGWPVSGIASPRDSSHPTRILASLSHICRNRNGTKKHRGHRQSIVEHVPTSCRLEMSRAILRTSTTRDKGVWEPLRNTSGTYRDLDSVFEILSRYCRWITSITSRTEFLIPSLKIQLENNVHSCLNILIRKVESANTQI